MRSITAFATIIILSMLMAVQLNAKPSNPPPGSFFRVRVTTVKQLVEHVRKDSVVRKRFARHFGINEKYIADVFAKNLHLVSLKKPLRVTSYYIGRKGRIYTKTKLLPKGTMIFADKTGHPVIAWSCGNPLTKKIIKPQKDKELVKGSPPEEVTKPVPEQVITPPTTIEDIIKETPVKETKVFPVVTMPGEVIAEVPTEAAVAATVFGGSGSPIFGRALAYGGSLPIIGSIVSGSRGSSGGGGGGGGDDVVVPEAPTSLSLIVGSVALFALGRTRKRRA